MYNRNFEMDDYYFKCVIYRSFVLLKPQIVTNYNCEIQYEEKDSGIDTI